MEGLLSRFWRVLTPVISPIFTKSTTPETNFSPPFRLYGTQDRTIATAAALLGVSGHTVGAMIRAGRLIAGSKPGTVSADSLGVMGSYFASLPTDPAMIPSLIEQARRPGAVLTLSIHEGVTATQRSKDGARTGYGPTLTGALVDLLAEDLRNQEVSND